jgi:glycopeptide antibiotics resistance protein
LKKRGWGKVLLASFGISLMVEILQFFHETRAFDINDLMFNTLGGLAGYGIYVLLLRMLPGDDLFDIIFQVIG